MKEEEKVLTSDLIMKMKIGSFIKLGNITITKDEYGNWRSSEDENDIIVNRDVLKLFPNSKVSKLSPDGLYMIEPNKKDYETGGIPKGVTYEYPLYFGDESGRQFVAIWYSFDEDRDDADAFFDKLVEEGAGPDEVLLKTSSGKYKKIDPNDLSDDEYELMNYGLQTSSIQGDKVGSFAKGGMTDNYYLTISPSEFSDKVERILDYRGVKYTLEPDKNPKDQFGTYMSDGYVYTLSDFDEDEVEDIMDELEASKENDGVGTFRFHTGDDPAESGNYGYAYYEDGGKLKENKTKKETMIAGGLLGIFLGIFLNR